jgi:hypothetical protein
MDSASDEKSPLAYKTKLFIAFIITVIVLSVICIPLYIFVPLSPNSDIFFIIWLLFISGFMIFVTSFMLMNVVLSGIDEQHDIDEPKTYATLTCKNGHKCRVSIFNTGYGRWFDFKNSRDKYHLYGGTMVLPPVCPECGVEWDLSQRPEVHREEVHQKQYKNS